MNAAKTRYWKGLPTCGEWGLLDRSKRVVLNSSQGKQPRGLDQWVEVTRLAIESMVEGCVAITSIGLNTWEMACVLAKIHRVPQVCLLPFSNREDFQVRCGEVRMDFCLEPSEVCFLGLPFDGRSPKRAALERDTLAVEMAEQIHPVSIRERGKLNHLLDTVANPKRICRDHQIEWVPSPSHDAFQLDESSIRQMIDPEVAGWLFHWTRAADGPWPGERRFDYYCSILESCDEYAHSARKTLERIVGERTLRASNWRIRGSHAVVAFTSLPPSESLHLFTWRKRYARFNAEPYGVGLHPDYSRTLGIEPVMYLSDRPVTSRIPIYLQQGEGRVGDWPRENEHRHLGDVDLSELPDRGWRTLELGRFRKSI